MTLEDLKNLEQEANRARRDAESATNRAKAAARHRSAINESGGSVKVEINGVSSYDCAPVREKLNASLLEHAPALLRVIELQEQAEAKRLTIVAETLEVQISAAIL